MRSIHRVLLVEDDPALTRSLRRHLENADLVVVDVDSVAEARRRLGEGKGFDVVLVDVQLPDGSGVDVAEAALGTTPMPIVVAMTGRASRQDAFALARLGVSALLEKPFTTSEVLGEIARAAAEPPVARLSTAPLVGHQALPEVLARVRSEMTAHALALADGNKTDAARLLGVTRQAVQQLAKKR